VQATWQQPLTYFAAVVGPQSNSQTLSHLGLLSQTSAVESAMDEDMRGAVLGLVVIIITCAAIFVGINAAELMAQPPSHNGQIF
jgi:hypothetical protein